MFASVHITEASEHQSLARSVISGVTKNVEQYGKVIVVEDDLICRQSFLNIVNDALNHYEKRKEVWSICGHTRHLKRLNQYPRDIYTTYRAGSWDWGTWKDRWDGIDWEVKDFPQLQNNKKLQRQFNRAGGDEYQMLVNQQAESLIPGQSAGVTLNSKQMASQFILDKALSRISVSMATEPIAAALQMKKQRAFLRFPTSLLMIFPWIELWSENSATLNILRFRYVQFAS